MPTPRKVTQDNWYDIWAEWPATDRAAAMRVLEQTHKQLVKVEARASQPKVEPAKPTQQELLATGNKAEE